MINFSYFSRDLKQDFSSFLFRNIYPFCSRPVNKFIRDLSFEIIKSGSLTISDIARTFNSNLNTVEKRLTIALGKYDLTSLIYHLQKHILDNLCNEPNRIIIDEQEYSFEKFKVKSLKAINNLCVILMIVTTYIAEIIVNKSIAYYHCLEAYKSFEDKEVCGTRKYKESGLMLYRIKRGMSKILTHTAKLPEVPGKNREIKYKQLKLF